MSENETEGGNPADRARRDTSESRGGNVVLSPGAARILAVVVLLTIGLAGMAGGVALDRYVILPRRYGMRPPDGPRFFPGGGRQAFIDRLNHYLELTPEQRTRFDSLMNAEDLELRHAREIAQPHIDSIVSETRREIDSILTPAQRDKLHRLREEGLGPRRGFGGRDSGGGEPGGRGRRGGPPPYP
jgi:Spy/CpxP family protein refolding chaperone